jgi:transposase
LEKGLYMSQKERERLKVVEQIRQKQLTYAQGAEQLDLSVRQLYRSMARYQAEGDEGLIHRLRGATSNRRYALKIRREVVELYRQRYSDYGPTLFVEKLLEHHGLSLGVETVRQWLLKTGVWKKARKGRRHRKRRERRAAIGEMIQFDGSIHTWFESRGPACCLLVAIDDASGGVVLRFVKSESTQEVLSFWKSYVEQVGIPKQIYTDYASVYFTPEGQKKTDYRLAMEQLGIECIYASSPQAKGRVERMNRTLQDRLLKALREHGITTMDEANQFLEQEFQEQFNTRFAHTNADDGIALEDHHRQCVYSTQELNKIFSFRCERRVNNDSTITLDARLIQLTPQKAPLPPRGTTVEVRRYLDTVLHIFWQGGEVGHQMVGKAKSKPPRPKGHPPNQEHPWLHKAPFGRARKRKRATA